MSGLLINRVHLDRHAELLARLATPEGSGGNPIQVIVVPEGESPPPLEPEVIASIKGAFFARDYANPANSRRLLGIARRAPNLKWMHLGNAGADDPIFHELMDRGVALTSSAGVTSEPIAQSAITGLLALNRGFPMWFDAQRRHEWARDDDHLPRDLRGQTMVVLGLGGIGGHIARFARAFGIHVIGVRRRPAGIEDGVDEWASPDRLREVLPRADVLAITVPLTAQTHHLIDAEMIGLMPRGAILINVARGPIIVESALIDAIRSGQLGGAYLDVFEEEPLPADSEIWDLPNVIVSPHDAGRSAGNTERIAVVFAEELEGWVLGRPSSRAVTDR